MLRKRLARRGLALSAAVLATALAQHATAAVPAALTVATVKGVLLTAAGHSTAGVVSVQAAALAQSLIRGWVVVRVQIAAVVLAVSLLGIGAGVWLVQGWADPPEAADSLDQPTLNQATPPAVLRLALREPVFAIAFSPNGQVLASGDGGRHLRLWQVATGNELTSVAAHQDEVSTVAFSPDGQVLASGGYDQTVRLWDAVTGKPLRTIAAHEDKVSALAFAPDGHVLASASWDRHIHLWDPATGARLRSLPGHRDRVWSIAFSPDGQLLASGSGDKTIRVWDVATGRQLSRLAQGRGAVFAVTFSPDGRILASSEDNQIVLRDAVTGQELRRVKGPQTAVAYFTFSPDGHTLAWADGEFRIHLWEMATGADRLCLEGHRQTVAALAFAADGKRLASGSADATIRLWDLAKQSQGRRITKGPLTPQQLETLWTDLGGEDAGKAYAAVWALATIPGQAVPFLKDQLPLSGEDKGRLKQMIAQLDDDDFRVREKASADLKKLGATAAPLLRRALEGQPSPEVRRRVEQLVAEIDRPRGDGATADFVQAQRALEALELMATPEARQALQTIAGRALDARVAQEAKRAGDRQAKKPATTP